MARKLTGAALVAHNKRIQGKTKTGASVVHVHIHTAKTTRAKKK